MNRRQKIIISVTGIFLVLLILVGLTYAYFLTQIQGNDETRSISVTTANLVLEYSDGNGILETDKLEPSNDYITFKDSQGNLVPSKIFRVTNKGNATVEGYKVYFESVQNQFERKDDLVYILSCKAYTNYGENNQAELETGCNGVSEETTFPDVITSIVSNDISVGVTHVYELKMKYKEMGVDQSVDMNKILSAKINIYDASTKFLAREIIDNASNVINGTSLILDGSVEARVANEASAYVREKSTQSIYPFIETKANNYYVTYACDYEVCDMDGWPGTCLKATEDCPIVKTTVKYTNSNEMIETLKGKYATWTTRSNYDYYDSYDVKKITDNEEQFTSTSFNYAYVNQSVSKEKIVATTKDDLGTSYYFRGGVEDNYVNFAGMCWRIVRIVGDGSIKLVLEDQDQLCNSKDNYGYLNMDGILDFEVTNFGYSNNPLMFEDVGGAFINYLNGDGNAVNYDKSMANRFKNLQTNILNKYLDKLKAGNWCLNDKAYANSNISVNSQTPLTEEQKNIIKNSLLDSDKTSVYYYDSYVRLVGNEKKEPTLKCNGTIMDKWGDGVTDMYVGALTADEIVYAGEVANPNDLYLSRAHSYYLYNDYMRKEYIYFWTLSPQKFSAYSDTIFVIGHDMSISDYSIAVNSTLDDQVTVRPTITLKTNIMIKNGNGTLENPYVIE